MFNDLLHQFESTSFCGVPCAQYFCDFYLWEAVLNENPQLRGIIELGTWRGGFSLYLKAQADNRDMFFITYDSAMEPDKLDKLFGEFVREDIFANEVEIGEILTRESPVALFCDNGNKPREMKTFPKYLREGSIIFVHDWMTEFLPKDIPDNVEPIYESFCDSLGSVTRVFKLKETSA